MNNVITPTKKLKRKIIIWLSLSEILLITMLLRSFLQSYSLEVSLILITTVAITSGIFNYYLWDRISKEYIMIGATYIEWNNIHIEWEKVEEIRIRKENNKPMFLILKVEGEYLKIPLRLFGEQVETIIGNIKKLDLEITE